MHLPVHTELGCSGDGVCQNNVNHRILEHITGKKGGYRSYGSEFHRTNAWKDATFESVSVMRLVLQFRNLLKILLGCTHHCHACFNYPGIHRASPGQFGQAQVVGTSDVQLSFGEVPARLHDSLRPRSRRRSQRCVVGAARLLPLQQTPPGGAQGAADRREAAVSHDE